MKSNKIVISHFYNESYLLPFWLEHHIAIFDHGILINHGSTDNSVEIIKKIAPNWEIIDSSIENFDPYLTDFEVQKIEEKTKGWKIALNITEFIWGDLDQLITQAEKEKINAFSLEGWIMIDHDPKNLIKSNKGLVQQKPFGIKETQLIALLSTLILKLRFVSRFLRFVLGQNILYRSRLFHRNKIGKYLPGRHLTMTYPIVQSSVKLLWFGFSPFDQIMIKRKLEIKSKLEADTKSHHRVSLMQVKFQFYLFRILMFFKKKNVTAK